VQLLFSQMTLLDLKEIHQYTVRQLSEPQADNYYLVLIEGFQNLLSFPKLGKRYEKLRTKPFGLKVSKHIIFYKIDKQNLYVIRVLHESMNLKTAF
jgi:toxin ParE1/3/4